MDGGAWWAIVHGVAESATSLSFKALTKELILFKTECAVVQA